jgi:diguanylate cyclase (GGDEF)-like protein
MLSLEIQWYIYVKFFAASTYWLIVIIWLTVLVTLAGLYKRNRRMYGTTQLLLAVLALDTTRNIIENSYFGLYIGAQLGVLPKAFVTVLGQPILLIIPKLINIVAGCFVFVVLLLRWLPEAVRERALAEAAAKALHELATTDSLTGLTNRRQFMALAEAECKRQDRYHYPLSLLMLDIDHFKHVNDSHGHDAGDQVLRLVADKCRSQVRGTDILARIGGEEFALVLIQTDASAALHFAKRLCKAISDEPFFVNGKVIAATVSIGVSEIVEGLVSLPEALKQADAALYEAKQTGRNRVCSFG